MAALFVGLNLKGRTIYGPQRFFRIIINTAFLALSKLKSINLCASAAGNG